MVNDQIRRNDETGGIASLFVAMIELGDATTKFTMNQLTNAVDMFMDPGRAIDRTRRSLNNFSVAMYRSARSDSDRHEIDTQKDLTGRRHTQNQQQETDQDENERTHVRAGGRHQGGHSQQLDHETGEDEIEASYSRTTGRKNGSQSHPQEHKRHSTEHAEAKSAK